MPTEYIIGKINEVVRGELKQAADQDYLIRDILIDSRRLIDAASTLFFALLSKKNDGHKYIGELYQKGVRNFIISQKSFPVVEYPDGNFILVDDTLRALQLLGAFHRKQFQIPVIGITGSNGKTIVKEWLFQLLHQDLNIIRSPKSYNSQIGVPLSVWQMKSEHDMAIFEAGISETEEMDQLQKIIQPTIGIFTNIGNAHDENFIHVAQKVGEKLKLFTKVDTLVYSTDHAEIQETIIRSEILGNINSFIWSYKQDADLRIIKVNKETGHSEINAIYNSDEISIEIPYSDAASIENAIHCWAVMLLLGYDNKIISERMRKLQPIAMRLELKEGVNNCTIINDAYNSDFNSLIIALDFLNQQKQHRKKTLILSDILQSGKNDVELYSDIAKLIESKGIDKFIGIGPGMLKHAGKFKGDCHFYASTQAFLKKHSFSTFLNESILLKGARIFEFEQVSQALQQKAHETKLEVNLNSLVHNLDFYRSKLKPGIKIMAMVKAFSYGSGSFEIANVLQFHHVDYLAVAYADEGVELRKAGIHIPIMIMNPDEESFDNIILHSLEPEIYNFRVLNLLEKAIEKNIIPLNKPVKVHIKIDTGMHRLGFEEEDVDRLIEKLKANKLIRVQSVFSHLAASNDPDKDDFTREQIAKFEMIRDKFKDELDHDFLSHISNSAAILRFPDAHFDMVRLGISLYGISSDPEEQKELENVSTMISTVSQVKAIPAGDTIGYNRSWKAENEMQIAIVPVGYADGISRILGNGKGHVLIRNERCPIVGDVCMDMIMVDVSGKKAEEGDEVIIFGKERPIAELAEEMTTIPYEIMSGISKRVKRVYFQE
ncbi:MAG: bifunctional UDP-N-acetylmuramoyl-tripeptide:D-alanyl-D-alanine ligase/alanine racemase [Bacteroidales bacterium]|nr:bifunctional UDP-N-acetylmuramoyl-tripeptide:D-alanyl-D-alanine ligase/alanine racemase [Bacteroidales bacterium]MCF8398246.1 bifunctional UDP-N-acetylmuramoyl-tripeptide:D-alanyl-D-alanine ligase/alanine racemase [Bacteroidales bacterium]